MAEGGSVEADGPNGNEPDSAPSMTAEPMSTMPDKPSTTEMGGLTPDEDDEMDRSIVEQNDEAKPKSDQTLAEAIRHYAEGGEVELEQPEYDGKPLGNKPQGQVSATGEPMSSMPSKPGASKESPTVPELQYGEELMNVIMAHKKKRKFK
jgi:hypothetical protein